MASNSNLIKFSAVYRFIYETRLIQAAAQEQYTWRRVKCEAKLISRQWESKVIAHIFSAALIRLFFFRAALKSA